MIQGYVHTISILNIKANSVDQLSVLSTLFAIQSYSKFRQINKYI